MSVENNDVLQRISSYSPVKTLMNRMDESVPGKLLTDEFGECRLTTKNHCIETADYYSKIIADQGYPADLTDSLLLGTLLHDTGKGRLPAEILYGSNVLTDEDRRLVATHPLWSARLIRSEADNDLSFEQPIFQSWQWDIAIAMAALHHSFKNREDRNYPTKKTFT